MLVFAFFDSQKIFIDEYPVLFMLYHIIILREPSDKGLYLFGSTFSKGGLNPEENFSGRLVHEKREDF
jgi:hypothetical protein